MGSCDDQMADDQKNCFEGNPSHGFKTADFTLGYGLFMALFYVCEQSWMNSKAHEPGLGGDIVNNPFSTVANFLLCVLYFNYLYLYRDNFSRIWLGDATDATAVEKLTSVNYLIATILFAIGYGIFGMGYAFSWDNEQEGGTWDGDLIWDMFIAGSALFTVASVFGLFNATKPWNFKISHWSDLLFGTEELTWHGYTFFLVGSACFWWGSHVGKDGEALLSQELFETGYILFLCGATVFMLSVVIGHYSGQRVIFGGSTAAMPEIREVLNIGLKFAEGFRKAGKECESETENHKLKV